MLGNADRRLSAHAQICHTNKIGVFRSVSLAGIR